MSRSPTVTSLFMALTWLGIVFHKVLGLNTWDFMSLHIDNATPGCVQYQHYRSGLPLNVR